MAWCGGLLTNSRKNDFRKKMTSADWKTKIHGFTDTIIMHELAWLLLFFLQVISPFFLAAKLPR